MPMVTARSSCPNTLRAGPKQPPANSPSSTWTATESSRPANALRGRRSRQKAVRFDSDCLLPTAYCLPDPLLQHLKLPDKVILADTERTFEEAGQEGEQASLSVAVSAFDQPD